MAPMGQARFLHSSAALDGYLVSKETYFTVYYIESIIIFYLSMLLVVWLMQRQDLILSNVGVQIQINGKTFALFQDISPAVVLFLVMDDFMSLVSKNSF